MLFWTQVHGRCTTEQACLEHAGLITTTRLGGSTTSFSSSQRATGRRRLLKLADLLETLPRKRFNYFRWVGSDWAGAPDLSCGTTACALGWASTVPAFRKLGLSLRRRGFSGVPVFQKEGQKAARDMEAGERLFNLIPDEAYYLFMPSGDETTATPKYVARKIRRFVENGLPASWKITEGEDWQ